jgi:hypothetical protein
VIFYRLYFSQIWKRKTRFSSKDPAGNFWVRMHNSMCHNGSKVAPKFEKHHVSRLLHPPCSPDISPCGFWLFGMLKGVLKGREFNSGNEIEEVIRRSGMNSRLMKCRASSTTGW